MAVRTKVLGALNVAHTIQVSDSVTGQIGFQFIDNTFVGTITFEATIDDTTWVSILRRQVGVEATPTGSTTTAAGLFVVDAAGVLKVRARVSAFTSGDVTSHALPHIG